MTVTLESSFLEGKYFSMEKITTNTVLKKCALYTKMMGTPMMPKNVAALEPVNDEQMLPI